MQTEDRSGVSSVYICQQNHLTFILTANFFFIIQERIVTKKRMIYKRWSDLDTFLLHLHSCSQHPEDVHMSGRNRLVNHYAIKVHPYVKPKYICSFKFFIYPNNAQ